MNRLALFVLPLALAACAQPPATSDAAPSDAAPGSAEPATTTPTAASDTDTLSTRHWSLREATDASGKRIDALAGNPDKPLQLDFAQGRINVSNACNRMGATYTLQGEQLLVGRMVSTQMACADARLMALEQAASERLQGSLKLARSGDTLTLSTAAGETLTFAGTPTAEARYGGPGETVFLEVAAQAKPCSHPLIPDMQCLQVRELTYDDKGLKHGTDGAFGNFYGSIEGYTHAPGIRNVLRVKRFKVDPAPADGSSLAYVLDMVVESETVAP